MRDRQKTNAHLIVTRHQTHLRPEPGGKFAWPVGDSRNNEPLFAPMYKRIADECASTVTAPLKPRECVFGVRA